MTRPRLLIVEDEGVIAMALEVRAVALGFDVVGRVSTAEAAVEAALAKLPDLILMDIQLAGPKDGIDAAREIRAAHDIPIIFITAYSDGNTRARADATLPAGYLTKPFDVDALQEALRTALDRR